MRTFDHGLLVDQLECLKPRLRSLFALTCSERLLPLYDRYCRMSTCGRWPDVRAAADALWAQIAGGTVVNPEGSFATRYASLAPNDDTPARHRTILDPLAENAILALGSAWECHLSGESEKALWAAEQAYEAMDFLAQSVEGLDYTEPEGEEALARIDLVQAELDRQASDLAMFTEPEKADFLELIEECRGRAIADGRALAELAERIAPTK